MSAELLFVWTVVWWVVVARVVVGLTSTLLPVRFEGCHPVAGARAELRCTPEPVLALLRRVLHQVRVGLVAVGLTILVIVFGIAVLRALLGG